jgi:hypothetical protein
VKAEVDQVRGILGVVNTEDSAIFAYLAHDRGIYAIDRGRRSPISGDEAEFGREYIVPQREHEHQYTADGRPLRIVHAEVSSDSDSASDVSGVRSNRT